MPLPTWDIRAAHENWGTSYTVLGFFAAEIDVTVTSEVAYVVSGGDTAD